MIVAPTINVEYAVSTYVNQMFSQLFCYCNLLAAQGKPVSYTIVFIRLTASVHPSTQRCTEQRDVIITARQNFRNVQSLEMKVRNYHIIIRQLPC